MLGDRGGVENVLFIEYTEMMTDMIKTAEEDTLTSRLATKSIDAYMSGVLSATRNVVPFSVVTTSAVCPISTYTNDQSGKLK